MTLDSRRMFLLSAGVGTLLVGCTKPSHSEAPRRKDDDDDDDKDEEEDEVTPAEDLMREHGVLRRVMYLYDDAALRLDDKRDVPLDALAAGAGMIRHVIEDYHEKIEEDFVFPQFEKAGKLAVLVATLRKQHQTGRTLTEQIMTLSKGKLAEADRGVLAKALRAFNHMYRPHAAREDTLVFPALRELVGEKTYEELGEQFEAKEKQMLGDHGFEHAVEDVAKLETAFGLDDLAKL